VGTAIEHPVPDRVKPSWHPDTRTPWAHPSPLSTQLVSWAWWSTAV